jgi:hypothetical protein
MSPVVFWRLEAYCAAAEIMKKKQYKFRRLDITGYIYLIYKHYTMYAGNGMYSSAKNALFCYFERLSGVFLIVRL